MAQSPEPDLPQLSVSDEEWSDESYASCGFVEEEDLDVKHADECAPWKACMEPINVAADRYVYVQRALLESMYHKLPPPTNKRMSFVKHVWSSIDPMRALVRVASVANAYFMMTNRDMIRDDRIGHYSRFHALNDYAYSSFEYLRNQYQPALVKQQAGYLSEWLAPVCFAVDEKHIAVRRLRRAREYTKHMLYTIETRTLSCEDAARLSNALFTVLKQNPSFTHLWNMVSCQDGTSVASMLALQQRLHADPPLRPKSIAPEPKSRLHPYLERRNSL